MIFQQQSVTKPWKFQFKNHAFKSVFALLKLTKFVIGTRFYANIRLVVLHSSFESYHKTTVQSPELILVEGMKQKAH